MEEDVMTRLISLERELAAIKDELYKGNTPTRRTEYKKVRFLDGFEIADGVTLVTGANTGAKIGATGNKIGFFGVTPVTQRSAISSPTGGGTVDLQARSVIDTIRTTLQDLGLTA